MKENERGDGLTKALLMETLEDRNAATCLGSFHLPVNLPVIQAHTHQSTPPAQSHGWGFGWEHSEHNGNSGHDGHGGCDGHHQSPPPASPPPASPPPAVTPSVSGVVYHDLNRDGVQEAGEQGQGGRLVWADANGNGTLDAGEVSTTTAADGSYKLSGLPAGTTLTILSINDNGTTSPGTNVTLQSGQQATGVNVGLVLPPS